MRRISTEHKIYLLSGLLLSLCSIVPIWLVGYFPSVNGPAFLFITHMFKEMSNPAFVYNEYFFPHLHYMPYLSIYFLLYCLSHLFTLATAQKIVLSLVVLLFPLSVFYFLKSIDVKKMVFGFPAYLIIYNFLFMRSYNNYVLAIALFFVFLGYWEKVKDHLTWKRLCVLNILLLLVFLSHIIVVLALLSTLCVLQLLENKSCKDIFRHMAAFALPTVVSIVYFVWFTYTNSIWQEGGIELEHWFFKFENLFLRFLWPYSMTGKMLALIPFGIVLFFIVYQKGFFFVRFVRHGQAMFHNTVENRYFILLLIIVMVYFCAPWQFFGWHKADVRVIPFIYIFILACCPPFGSQKTRTAFAALTTVFALILFVHVGNQVVKLDKEITTEYLSGLEHVEKNKTMLPLSVGESEFDVLNPYAHLHDYYGIFRGTITGKSLAMFNTISPVWYKDYKEFPHFSRFPGFHASALAEQNHELIEQDLENIRSAYDYVLIWGNDKRIETLFSENGFIKIFENKRLHLFEIENQSFTCGGNE